MKKALLILLVLPLTLFSQTVLFTENFELPSLADSVISSGNPGWAISTNLASQGLRSDSTRVATSDTTTLTTLAFSTVGSSNVILSFSHICKIEYFDFAEIFVSNNNGASWTKLTSSHYLGTAQFATQGDKFAASSYIDWDAGNNSSIPTNAWWKTEQFDISALVSNFSQVRVRFVLRDGNGFGHAGNYGWLIDDIRITGATGELIPPIITMNTPIIQDTVFNTGPFNISADITDASGIALARVVYKLNNGVPDTISMVKTTGNTFVGTIPSFTYNNKIEYFVFAVDSSPMANKAQTINYWFYTKKGPNIITIGTGTVVNGTQASPTPYGNYYWGSKDLYLITAAELTAAGMSAGAITSIAWDVTNVNACPGLTNFTIKMGHTTLSALSNWVAGLSDVFTVASYQPVTGWNTHSLTTPFIWNGTSNLLVEACFNNPGYLVNGNASVNQTTTPYVSTINLRQDNATVCANTTTAPTLFSQRPNIRFAVPPTNNSYDAGVSTIEEPMPVHYTLSTSPIKIRIKNYAVDSLKKVTINYSVDGVVKTPYVWTGVLLQDVVSPILTVGNEAFTLGSHSLKVWTTLPNDSNDQNTLNDTLIRNFIVCSGMMAGSYTIGGAGANFPTFVAAVSQLANCGISAPVIFNVAAGTYTEQVTIPAIIGVSATNTVTFKAANNDSSSVILTFAPLSSADNWTVRLNGAQRIRFTNMTIRSTGVANGRVVEFINGAHYNEFANNVIRTVSSTATTYSGFHSTSASNNNFNIIRNNWIQNGYYGIYLQGMLTTNKEKGNIIQNNRIDSFYYYGIYHYSQDSTAITGNLLNKTASTSTMYGIYAYYIDGSPQISDNTVNMILSTGTIYGIACGYTMNARVLRNKINTSSSSSQYALYTTNFNFGGRISKNQIFSTATSTGLNSGIYLVTTNGTVSDSTIVDNNFVTIAGGTTNTTYGIYTSTSAYTSFLYNSVNVTGGSPTSGYAFYSTGGNNNNILNNNLANAAGGYSIYVVSITEIKLSNRNNLFTTGTNLGYWNANRTNLAAWITASAQDSNSVSTNPMYASPTDLHIFNSLLDGKALPLAAVVDDIDNEARHATTPDIGADEFVLPANDAGLISMTSPVKPCHGINPISVRLRNNGSNSLASAVINWSVNGIAQTAYNFAGGTVPTGLDTIVPIGSFNFDITVPYDLRFIVSMPNGSADPNAFNDTVFVNGVRPSLTGTYSIGAAPSNFDTIAKAITYLNVNGICGPVVFEIKNGIYNESLVINQFIGTSPINTVTVKPAVGANVEISSAATTATIRLAGADNIIIDGNNGSGQRSLQIINTSTATNTAALWVSSMGTNLGAIRNVIRNTRIMAGTNVVTSTFGIYVAGTTISTTGTGADNDFLTIENNEISRAYNGIYARGVATTPGFMDTLLINKNIIGSATPSNYVIFRGIDITNAQMPTIIQNQIFNLQPTTAVTIAGIDIGGTTANPQIQKNRIHGLRASSTTATGVYGINISSTAVSSAWISNNFVYDILASNASATSTATNPFGIRIVGGNNHKIYYNSINLFGNSSIGTSGTLSSAIALTNAASTGIDIRNNSFANRITSTVGTTKSYAIYAVSGLNFDTIRYNNYFVDTLAKGILGFNGADRKGLPDWQTAVTKDTASISSNPQYYSNTDLHTFSQAMNSAGRPVGGIVDDIDGDLRDLVTPDIGADEFTPKFNDVGVLSMVGPIASCPGVQQVKVVVKNYSVQAITPLTVNWSINGIVQVPFIHSTPVAIGAEDTLTIGTYNFVNLLVHNIVFWTSNPNNTLDDNNINDTLKVNNFYTSLAGGTYTIGQTGADFNSFTSVGNRLNSFGICGPVIFNVSNGTYNEQFVLNEASGSSSINTITFQSLSGVKTDVILSFAPTLTNFNYTLKFDGADNIIFKNMTIGSTGTSFARVIDIGNFATNIRFEGNTLIGTVTALTSDALAVVYSASGTTSLDSNNVFLNNLIQNGSYGMFYYGGSTSLQERGTQIINNQFLNNSLSAMYLGFLRAVKITGNQINTNTANTGFFGIYTSACHDTLFISKNKISITNGGAGIHILNSNGISTNRGVISNNFVHVGGASAANSYGIYNEGATWQGYYYNSINITGTSLTNGRAIFMSSASNNIDLRNNIFANHGGGYAYYSIAPVANYSSNNNDLYSAGTAVGFHGGLNRNTLADWISATTKDSLSVSVKPYYISNTDLHTFEVGLNNKGTTIAGITDDIDGEPRHSTTPDIGADEFTPVAIDLGIIAGITPTGGCDQVNKVVSVRVRNFGTDTINGGFNLNYQLIGAPAIVNQSFGDTLFPAQEKVLSFTTTVNLVAPKDSIFQIRSFVNIAGDNTKGNDTLVFGVNSLYTPIAPITANVSIPWNTSTTITATSPDTLFWYDSPTGGTPIGSGANYTTPVLIYPKTYFVEAKKSTMSPGSLSTIWTGGTNCGGGFMIDIVSLSQNITINKFDLSCFNTGTQTVNVYYKVGTYDGFTTTPTAWILQGTYTVNGLGSNIPTPMPINDLIIPAGQTYGIYLQYHSQYTSASAITTYSNSHIQLITGMAHCSAWDGCCTPRTFNGTVYYNVGAVGCTSPRSSLTVNMIGMPAINATLDSIVMPVSVCNIGSKQITVRIKGLGWDTIKGNYTMGYQIQGSSTIVTETASDTILPLASSMFTFATPINFNAPTKDSTYIVKAFVKVPSDTMPLNDSITGSVLVKYVPPVPLVSNITIPYGSSTTLNIITNDSIIWYSNSGLTNPVAFGKTFITPLLYDTTTYYVVASSTTSGSLTATLGTGALTTSATGVTPYSGFYEGSRIQYLVRGSELANLGFTAGNISSLAFNVTTPGSGTYAQNNFTLKIAHTTANALTDFNIPAAGFTTVFGPQNITHPVTGWNTITFSNQFVWNGTSNIIVEVCHDNDPTGSCGVCYATTNSTVSYTATTFNSVYGKYADNTPMCGVSNGTVSTAPTNRPNIRFNGTWIVPGCSSSPATVKVSVTAPPLNDASLAQIVSPTGTIAVNNSTPVSVIIKNFGQDTLKKVNIGWSVNGTLQTPFAWTGALLTASSSSPFVIGSFISLPDTNHIKAWTYSPNDSLDLYNFNDTAKVSVYACVTSGTYIVGSGGHYPNIQSALNAISTCTLSGPVVFNIKAGTYNGQFLIPAINGASTTNTITFQSQNANPDSVTLAFGSGLAADNFVLKFTGGDYFIFKNLTLKANGTLYGRVVEMSNNSTFNKFEGNKFVGPQVTSTSVDLALVYSASTASSLDSMNQFIGNTFTNGAYGINLWGASTTSLEAGTVIKDNTFTNQYYMGIYLYFQNYPEVSGNIINTNTAYTLFYGIYMYYCDNEMKVIKNKVNIPAGGYGIYNYYSDGTASRRGLTANNFVSMDGSSTATIYGIVNNYSTFQDIYYNSVNVFAPNNSSMAIWLGTSSAGIDLRNNIFANNGGGYAVYSTVTTGLTADYNNLFTSGVNLGYWSTNQIDLAAWKLASSLDANSLSVKPLFFTSTNLHTFNIDLNGAALPIVGITDDIDGDLRSTSAPDIGADEFTPPANDAGLFSFDAPKSPTTTGLKDIKVTLRNYGTSNLVSVAINWSVNGNIQPSFAWTGVLLSGQKADSVVIGQFSFTTINNNIKVWASNPNGLIDGNNLNDTISENITVCLGNFKGIYTIGTGMIFPTITSAIQAMSTCGIDSAVVFNISSGTYNEKLIIPEIIGSSVINTITFRPTTGATVLISNNSTTATIQLNGADNVIFDGSNNASTSRNMTITNTSSAANTAAIWVSSLGTLLGSTNNTIKNCNIIAGDNNITSTFGIHIGGTTISTTATGADNDNITISNNHIQRAYIGIYARGPATATSLDNLVITNNLIGSSVSSNSIQFRGLDLGYALGTLISGNEIFNLKTTSSINNAGIELNAGMVSTLIFKNKIYGIYSTSSGGWGAYGININSTVTDNIQIYNNFIYDLITANYSTTSTIYNAFGIRITGGTNHKVYFNTINLYGPVTSGSSAGMSAAFCVTSSTATGMNVRNNIFANSTAFAIAGAKSYAAYVVLGTAFAQIDRNDYFASGTNAVLGFYGSDKTTLLAWQQTSLKDSNSISVDPLFFAMNNLHVTSPSLNAVAAPIVGILDDIDGDLRHTTTPDIGADEFIPQLTDAGVKMIASPLGNLAYTAGLSVPVKVAVQNYGSNPITSMTVRYTFNGAPAVNFNYTGNLLSGQTDTVIFLTQITIVSGTNNLCVNTVLTGDANSSNDTVCINFHGISVALPPWSDNFEGINHWWAPAGSLWQKGLPTATTINTAKSPVNVWATNLSGFYSSNNNEYLYSPLFDFSNVTGASLKFWHWYQTETGQDAGRVQVSTDGGQNWSQLGYVGDTLGGTTWYTHNLAGTHGWSGNSNGWVQAVYDLTAYNSTTNLVQFRFHFFSNATNHNFDGWAIDDFEVYIPPATIDGGISAFVSPVDSTVIGSVVQVQVRIKNFGATALTNIPVSYKINAGTPVAEIWTGTLAAGADTLYTFTTTYIAPNTDYQLCAYTAVIGDLNTANNQICRNLKTKMADNDVGILAIIAPAGQTYFPSNITVQVSIKNYGKNVQTSIPVEYDINGVFTVKETWTGALASGATATYTFTGPYASPLGNYIVCARTKFVGDADTTNNFKCVTVIGSGINEIGNDGFKLGQNIPNPANHITLIPFEIPSFGKVKFELIDVIGQKLSSVENNYPAGSNQIEIDLIKLPSGIYYYSIEYEGRRLTRKMVISR